MLIGDGADTLALFRAALYLGRVDNLPSDDNHTMHLLKGIAEVVGSFIPADAKVGDHIYAMNQVLFDELDFSRLRDTRHSSSHHIGQLLQIRQGTAAGLALVYLVIGRLNGMTMNAVPFPGTYLIAIDGNKNQFINPSESGRLLGRDDLHVRLSQYYDEGMDSQIYLDDSLADDSDQSLLARIIHDMRRAYVREDQWERALWLTDAMLELKPDRVEEHRERAKLLERIGCHRAARDDYRRYLDLMPNAGDRIRVQQHLHTMEQMENVLH